MNFKYKIIDGEVILCEYICQSISEFPTSVIIPESINGYPVTKIGSFSFTNCNTILNVILPNSITYLGVNSFAGNDILTINGIELKEGVNVINNRFIFYNNYTSNILYQIGDDYVCDDGYFMDGEFDKYLRGLHGF